MVPNFIISSIIITIIILNWETKQESQKYEEVFQKSMSFCFENWYNFAPFFLLKHRLINLV